MDAAPVRGHPRRISRRAAEQEPLSAAHLAEGGRAGRYLRRPRDTDRISRNYCASPGRRSSIPWIVIGGGYNLLVRDEGFRGAAIALEKLNQRRTPAANQV